nr:hypothetical protein [Micromonospora sp. DSM 115978]
MLDFDPIAHFDSDTWIRSEVTRAWKEATADTSKAIDQALITDLGQDHFIGLVLSLESVIHKPILAEMHRFTGTTIDDFIHFVDDLAGGAMPDDDDEPQS